MAANTFFLFPHLSPELREKVRAFAFASKRTDLPDLPGQREYRGLAPFACVNQEWQVSVEKLLFHHLLFKVERKPSDQAESLELHYFRTIVTGSRRSFFSVISFDIFFKLKTLDLPIIRFSPIQGVWHDGDGFVRPFYNPPDSLFTRQVDELLLSHIRDLYRILQSWKVNEWMEGKDRHRSTS